MRALLLHYVSENFLVID